MDEININNNAHTVKTKLTNNNVIKDVIVNINVSARLLKLI